jgi:hypothetical protein
VVLKQEFVGCNEVEPVGVEYAGWNSNFFYGNVSEKWCTEVPNWGEVWYYDLWAGIDLRYYTNDDGLKYDLIVHPGASVEQITLRYAGAVGLRSNGHDCIIIETRYGNIWEDNLFIYQQTNAVCRQIRGEFTVGEGLELGFRLLDAFDPLLPLIIDPYIGYSTFVGGSMQEMAFDVEMDSESNSLVTGWARSLDFPTSPGSYQTNQGGMEDIFVFKLDSTGSSLLFSTYIGGSSAEIGRSIAIDSSDCPNLVGTTQSTDFPTTMNAFDTQFNGEHDIIFLKLNSNGSSLLYSTFIGGGNVDMGRSLSIASAQKVYIAGNTRSGDFPLTGNAFDSTFNGGDIDGDAFVLQFNPSNSSLGYSTFVGGSGNDMGKDLAVDADGNAYVGGHTRSIDFPTTTGAYDTEFCGTNASSAADGFIFKLNQTGASLIYCTYIGGNKSETGGDISIDASGNAFMTGSTKSLDFPTTTRSLDTVFSANDTIEAFALKLDCNGSSLLYSTFIGGSGKDWGKDIVVDCAGKAIIIGTTQSTDFPVTSDALYTSYNGL